MAEFVHPLGDGDYHLGDGIAGHVARNSSETGYEHMHGVDLMMNHQGGRLPVYAVADGVISVQRGAKHPHPEEWKYGHDSGHKGIRAHLSGANDNYFYQHMERMAPGLHPGDHVKAGQMIGWTGADASGGTHLHISCEFGNTEKFLHDASRDPADYGPLSSFEDSADISGHAHQNESARRQTSHSTDGNDLMSHADSRDRHEGRQYSGDDFNYGSVNNQSVQEHVRESSITSDPGHDDGVISITFTQHAYFGVTSNPGQDGGFLAEAPSHESDIITGSISFQGFNDARIPGAARLDDGSIVGVNQDHGIQVLYSGASHANGGGDSTITPSMHYPGETVSNPGQNHDGGVIGSSPTHDSGVVSNPGIDHEGGIVVPTGHDRDGNLNTSTDHNRNDIFSNPAQGHDAGAITSDPGHSHDAGGITSDPGHSRDDGTITSDPSHNHTGVSTSTNHHTGQNGVEEQDHAAVISHF